MHRLWFSAGILAAGALLMLSLDTRMTHAFADDGQSGELHVIKNCNNYTGQPGSYCTIVSSNLVHISAGAKVFYDQAFGVPDPNPPNGMLDSNIVLYVGTGDWAVGRCTLDGNTNLGLCTFSDGVGKLSGFHARLAVAPASGANNYTWIGPYHFDSN
jgi:hypothetical protein